MTPLTRLTCEETFRRLDDYVDRELSADEMTAVREHLTHCERCAREFRFEESVLSAIRAKMAQLRIELPPDLESRVLSAIRAAR